MPAELILENGRAITFDPSCEEAQAVAVSDGRIAAVGSNQDVAAWKSPRTRVIDAQGGTILPGFIDSHVHLFIGAAELEALDLTGIEGEDALTGVARAYAAGRPEDRIVYAVGADYGMLGRGRQITRQDLDRVLPDRPFAMMAADHHTVWANTAALQAAGLLDVPPDLQGAEVVRGPDGKASGMLLETGAFGPVLALTKYGGRDLAGYVTGADPDPAPTARERATDQEVIAKGLAHCAANGITTLHNMDGNLYQLELLDAVRGAGDMVCRVQVPCHLRPEHGVAKLAEAQEMRARFDDDWLWSGRVKMFMDGVIDGYTAFMLRPYPGRPDTRGEALFDAEVFDEICVAADAIGLQISVHAIGDAAVRRALDGFAAAQRVNGVRDSRHRVEHIETLHADDLPRFAELGAVASMQPMHAPAGGMFPVPSADLLHPDQVALAFPWQSLSEAGAALVFSTDWSVVPVDVMPSIRAAVAPRTPEGWPDQGLSLRQALAAYTRDNAWVAFREDRKGRLAAGYLADLAFPWRSLSEAGAALVFSTDWSVVPVDVMPSIRAAVAPRTPEGWPDQGLSLRQALAAYTRDNAWVAFREDRKGRLAAGYLADLVVMSDDLDALAPAELDKARPLVTICGGRVTYEA